MRTLIFCLLLFQTSKTISSDSRVFYHNGFLVPQKAVSLVRVCNLIGKWKDTSGNVVTVSIVGASASYQKRVQINLIESTGSYIGGTEIENARQLSSIAAPIFSQQLLEQQKVKVQLAMIDCFVINGEELSYVTLLPISTITANWENPTLQFLKMSRQLTIQHKYENQNYDLTNNEIDSELNKIGFNDEKNSANQSLNKENQRNYKINYRLVDRRDYRVEDKPIVDSGYVQKVKNSTILKPAVEIIASEQKKYVVQEDSNPSKQTTQIGQEPQNLSKQNNQSVQKSPNLSKQNYQVIQEQQNMNNMMLQTSEMGTKSYNKYSDSTQSEQLLQNSRSIQSPKKFAFNKQTQKMQVKNEQGSQKQKELEFADKLLKIKKNIMLEIQRQYLAEQMKKKYLEDLIQQENQWKQKQEQEIREQVEKNMRLKKIMQEKRKCLLNEKMKKEKEKKKKEKDERKKEKFQIEKEKEKRKKEKDERKKEKFKIQKEKEKRRREKFQIRKQKQKEKREKIKREKEKIKREKEKKKREKEKKKREKEKSNAMVTQAQLNKVQEFEEPSEDITQSSQKNNLKSRANSLAKKRRKYRKRTKCQNKVIKRKELKSKILKGTKKKQQKFKTRKRKQMSEDEQNENTSQNQQEKSKDNMYKQKTKTKIKQKSKIKMKKRSKTQMKTLEVQNDQEEKLDEFQDNSEPWLQGYPNVGKEFDQKQLVATQLNNFEDTKNNTRSESKNNTRSESIKDKSNLYTSYGNQMQYDEVLKQERDKLIHKIIAGNPKNASLPTLFQVKIRQGGFASVANEMEEETTT